MRRRDGDGAGKLLENYTYGLHTFTIISKSLRSSTKQNVKINKLENLLYLTDMETHATLYITYIEQKSLLSKKKKKTFSDLSENQLAFDIKAFCRYTLQTKNRELFLVLEGN